jgi:hypothetical protein
MTPKDLAVKDMKEDLSKENKSFLAFHNELNPVMRKIVSSQIRKQVSITNPFNMPVRHKTQLMARCFFCKVKLNLKTTASIMKVNKFFKNLFSNFMENLLLLIAGLIMAVALLSIICGDGTKGLCDLL